MDESTTRLLQYDPVVIELENMDFALRPLDPRGSEYSKSTVISQQQLEPEGSAQGKAAIVSQTKVQEGIDETEVIDVRYPRVERWVPLYLKSSVLTGFIVIYISLVVILAVLFGYSQIHHGLCVVNTRDHYVWTYVPTAVFTFISAFWAQVVYRTKQTMPWRAMRAGPQPPKKSVTLDYVSPLLPIALFKSLANRHHSVSLAIFSSLTFSVLSISSTSLFTAAPVEVTVLDASLISTDKFDLSNFDWSSVDSRPASVAYAAAYLGLGYTSKTTAQYAVQDFTYPQANIASPSNSSATSSTTSVQSSSMLLTGIVDTFSAWLDCPNATMDVIDLSRMKVTTPTYQDLQLTADISAPDCTLPNVSVVMEDGLNTVHAQPSRDQSGLQNVTYDIYWGSAQILECSKGNEPRILISAGTVNTSLQWNVPNITTIVGVGPILFPTNITFRYLSSRSVLCTPRYEIQQSSVSKRLVSSTQTIFESIVPIGNSSSQDQTAVDIARGVFQSTSDPTFQRFFPNTTGDNAVMSFDMFFRMLMEALSTEYLGQEKGLWFEEGGLFQHARALYTSIAAQLATTKLTVPSDKSFSGMVHAVEQRLVVRILSFILMEACLLLLAAATAWLLFSVSQSALSHDPGTIAGIATVFGNSRNFTSLLTETGHLQGAKIDDILGGKCFKTSSEDDMSGVSSISVIADSRAKPNDEKLSAPPTSLPIKWWRPLALHPVSQTLIVGTPLVYIIVLELLLRSSRSKDGLYQLQTNSWLHYGWTYIPALLMVFVRLAYDAVTFSIQVLSPFSALRGKSAPASVSVRDHPLSRTALHGLFVSIKQRQMILSIASTAALIAPLLTVAVSGLYVVDRFDQIVQVRQLTGWAHNQSILQNATLLQNVFNYTNESNPIDSAFYAPTLTNLIVTANLSYPRWSYDEFALPLVEVVPHLSGNNNSSQLPNGTLQVVLPAARGGFNCSVVPHDQVNVAYTSYEAWEKATGDSLSNSHSQADGSGARVAVLSTNLDTRLEGCTLQNVSVLLPQNATASEAFGFIFRGGFNYPANETRCSDWMGAFGSATANKIEDYTWFYCSMSLETVMTKTTFIMPEYDITAAVPDEKSVQRINDDVYWWIPADYLTFYNITAGRNYDAFFSALVYGRDGVPASELLGAANELRLLSAVQHLWRVIYAQIIRSSNEFLSADSQVVAKSAPSGYWNGTLMDPGVLRLKQNIASTRALEVILGALALCAIIVFVGVGTIRIVPNEPCNIAVMGSLLADSDLLDVITLNRGEGGAGSRHRSKQWQGYLFSLGWWNRPNRPRRFGIDIGKADKID